jgi:hydroxyacylglutathione hydrolase
MISISALQTNYIWVKPDAKDHVLLVDPGDAQPVLDYLEQTQKRLSAIVLTHHHHDHVGGVSRLLDAYPVPVFGPKRARLSYISHPVDEGDRIALPGFETEAQVMGLPAHTLDHVAYYVDGMLFCGDTLFSAGCGRVFEGSMQQMHDALMRIRALPDDTVIYCAHEYTEDNLRFALTVLPDDAFLQQHQKRVAAQFQQEGITLPSTLAIEKEMNLFLRLSDTVLQQALSAHAGRPIQDTLDAFTVLRTWKDHF